MDEIFASTFDYLIHSLSPEINSNSEESHVTELISDYTQKKHEFISSQYNDNLIYQRKKILSLHEEIISNVELMKLRYMSTLDNFSQYKIFVNKVLNTHQHITDRRLRELVFEIIGEYAKTRVRVERRYEYLKFFTRVERVVSINKLHWKRFILRFNNELNKRKGIKLSYEIGADTILCPKKHISEYILVRNYLIANGSSACHGIKNPYISAVIKLKRPRVKHDSVSTVRDNQSSDGLVVASTVSELLALISQLQGWYIPPSTSSRPISSSRNIINGTNRQPVASLLPNSNIAYSPEKFKLHNVLSASWIEWMNLPSYHPITQTMLSLIDTQQIIKNNKNNSQNVSITNHIENQKEKVSSIDCFESFSVRYALQNSAVLMSDRLYYCLEERVEAIANNIPFSSPAKVDAVDPALNLLKYIEHVYIANPNHLQSSWDWIMINAPHLLTSSDIKAQAKYIDNVSNNIQNIRSNIKMSNGDIGMSTSNCNNDHQSNCLVVVRYLSSHRDDIRSSFNNMDMVRYFPDVVQVLNISTFQIFHFVPSIVLNLPELYEFSQCNLSSDQLRNTRSKCGHPHMPSLTSADGGGSLIHHLYHISKYVTTEDILPHGEGRNTRPQIEFCQVLSAQCTRELLRCYLWPETIQSRQGECRIDIEADLPERLNEIVSCCYIPDDAVHHIDPVCVSQKLNYSYAIMRSDVMLDSNDNAVSATDNEIKYINFYFVQFRERSVRDHSASIQHAGNLKSDSKQLNDNSILQYLLNCHINEKNGNIDPNDSTSNTLGNNNTKSAVWDTTLMSTLCRWRACTVESCPESTSRCLCKYHLELKSFLDSLPKPNNQDNSKPVQKESHKFLPKKVPTSLLSSTSPSKDLEIMKSVSSLIQELWDGKLKTTLDNFSVKAGTDCSMKRRLESLRGGIAVHRPSWMKWRNEGEYSRIVGALNTALQLNQMICQLERETTIELQTLQELKIFPTAEIAVIKKERKAFLDSTALKLDVPGDQEMQQSDNSTEQELNLSERKLSIIRNRRMEEQELLVNVQKKALKAKQIEEAQARDPANFRNQRKF